MATCEPSSRLSRCRVAPACESDYHVGLVLAFRASGPIPQMCPRRTLTVCGIGELALSLFDVDVLTHLGGTRDPSGSRDSVSDGAAWRRVAANPAQNCRVRRAAPPPPGDQRPPRTPVLGGGAPPPAAGGPGAQGGCCLGGPFSAGAREAVSICSRTPLTR